MSSTSFVLVLFCTIGSIACHRRARAEIAPPIETPVAVPTVLAVAAPTPEVISLTGLLAADQRAEVTSDTAGKVLAVLVERGQRVARGQPAVRLDVTTAALRAGETSAQLDAARAEQRLAGAECERSARLYALGAISGTEADRQRALCSSTASQVAAAEARAAVVGKGVTDGVVRAPFDGVVAERTVTAGEWVVPGRPLFTLVDAEPLHLELSVPEAHLGDVVLGRRVELATVAKPHASYGATITRIGAEIGRTRSLTVEATVDPDPALLPGMFVEARLIVGHTMRPTLPDSAVAQRGGSWRAFVVRDGVVEERVVQVGPPPAPGAVSILQSIAPGDRVVRTITPQIVDGLRVE